MAMVFALSYVGFVLGQRWHSDPTLRELFHQFDTVIVIAVLAGFVWFIWSRWRESRTSDR
jgi:membrane protein DedA with SNARE-associated domain